MADKTRKFEIDGDELIPILEIENNKPKRRSDPGKQLAAGVADIFTGIPGLAGLVGAAGEATYDTAIGNKPAAAVTLDKDGVSTPIDNPGGFVDNFTQSLASGWPESLMKMGDEGRKGTNKLLGIEEPVSTEDIAARTAGNFFPVPGFNLANSASKSLKAANLAFNLLTPVVKSGKGFTRRAAGQQALGVGMNEGIKAVQDSEKAPLLFSDSALAGLPAIDMPGGDEIKGDIGDETLGGDPLRINIPAPISGQVGDEVLGGGTNDDDIIGGTDGETFSSTLIPIISEPEPEIERDDRLQELKEMDARVQREQDSSDAIEYGKTALQILLLGAGARWARQSAIKNNVINTADPLKKQATDFGNFIFEKSIDKAQAIDTELEKLGFTEATRNKVTSNAHTDPIDIAANFNATGKLGQGFVPRPGMEATSPAVLDTMRTSLGPDGMKLFDEGMVAQSQRATIQNTTPADPNSPLWKAAQNKITRLDETILAARGNEQVKELMNKFSETFDVLLDYQVHRGVLKQGHSISPEVGTANWLRQRATLGDVPGGRLAYMPLYAKTETQFFKNMAQRYLGKWTKEGRKADIAVEYGARDVNITDASELYSPVQAMQRYALSTISHANEQSFKGGILDSLARVTRNGDDITIGTQRGQAASRFGPEIPEVKGARDTVYLGKGTDLSDINNIPITIRNADDISTREFKSGSINDLVAQHGDAIQVVHQGGEVRVYYVPDPGLRAAVKLSPQLGPVLKTFSNWKNLFTQLTTGNLSLFAPTSGLYSAGQVALNTYAKEGVAQGLASIGHSLKGTARLATDNGSGAIANYLAKRIAKTVGEGGMPKEFTKNLQERLHRRFINSTVNQVRRETGRTVTSVGNIGNGTLDEIMGAIGQDSARYFGKDQIGLVKELWQTWNTAWHEGPAFGAMLRHEGDALLANPNMTPKQHAAVVREAVDVSKTVAGDMRRIGTSKMAEVFNATFPFSAAMLQSWNSIGAAAKKNPVQFLAGATALIGVPTMSELAWNENLDKSGVTFPDKKGKQWGYTDYYYNGFTTEQRNNNFIYYKPGKPPWEAVLVPISPEWTLFRAMTLEGADAVFGLSTRKGNLGELTPEGLQIDSDKVGRDHWEKAKTRVLDLPTPPPIAAIASFFNTDLQLGLSSEITADPDNPGRTTSFIRTKGIGKGERITSRSGKTQYAEGDISRKYAAIIQDIFGAAGSAYINMHEAVAAGLRGREGSIGKAASAGLNAVIHSGAQQMRYIQPLYGKVLRPNENDEIAQSLFVSRANMKQLGNQLKNGILGGGLLFSNGKRIVGNDTIVIKDDPRNMELASFAADIDANIGQLDKEISDLRRDKSTMGNSMLLGTHAEKLDKMDAVSLKISSIKATQMAIIHDFEEKISHYLTEKYGTDEQGNIIRHIDIDLTSYQARPDTKEGSQLKDMLRINIPAPSLTPK